MYSNTPRWYTALAEWAVCMLFILIAPKKRSALSLWLICPVMLTLQMTLLICTGQITDWRWVVIMLIAFGLMFVFLWLCCDVPLRNVGFYCVKAVLLAELMAALEWQIYAFSVHVFGAPHSPQEALIHQFVYLLLVFGSSLVIAWRLELRYVPWIKSRIEPNDLLIAILIGILTFTASNLGYLENIYTPLSGSSGMDTFIIRTLVDANGVAVMYIYYARRVDERVLRELSAINTLLQKQHDQYIVMQDNIEVVNRKYHDIKNLISVLRAENNSGNSRKCLDELEGSISQYGADFKTGNTTLDTLLAAKSLTCQHQGIELTCVADGTKLDFIGVPDLCAIFGNALDNAIEGTLKVEDRERRLIHLAVSQQKQFVLIQIENYFGGELTFEDNLPVTTKQNRQDHGFGLKSIRHSVRNHDGVITISAEDGWFRLKILIPIPGDLK